MQFGKLINYCLDGNKVILNYEKEKVIVTILKDDLINIKQDYERKFSLTNDDLSCLDFKITFKDKLHIKTKSYTYIFNDDLMLEIYYKNILISSDLEHFNQPNVNNVNKNLLALEGHSFDDNSFKYHLDKSLYDDDIIYGLGEKTGYLNKREYEYEMWNTDNPMPHVDNFKALYKSVPFYIVHSKKYSYGFFFLNTYKTNFDLGKKANDRVIFSYNDGKLDYYFIGGNNLKEVISNYTLITGRTPMPARFTLGYQQSRWSYNTKDEIMTVAKLYRDNKIPCDTLFLDIDYMDNFKVFTYDEAKYPRMKEIVATLKKDGFKVVPIIDPGVKYEKGYFMCDEALDNKLVATYKGETYFNAVWPGKALFPSFINPKAALFWQKHVEKFMDLGFAGIWNDMNEPASFNGPLPDDVEFSDGKEVHYHKEIHNIYAHYMDKATFQGIKNATNKRPYVITRAAFSGTQKYSTVWTGDNHSIWPHLQMMIPMLLNLSMSGFSFCGSDVGGFGSDVTPELLLRWVEAASFTPLFRNHSAMGTRRQEPWTFTKDVLTIYRKAVERRYHLIPYFYDLYYEQTKNGIPPLRPLVLEFQNDFETFNLNDEFMLGSQMIVAPILTQGSRRRMVYLPKGKWYNYFDFSQVNDGYNIFETPLDEINVFVKEGSIIPNYPLAQYVKESDVLFLRIYKGMGEYLHYQDCGDGFEFENGEYNLYHISHNDGNIKIELIHNGYKKYKEIRILYAKKEVIINSIEDKIEISI